MNTGKRLSSGPDWNTVRHKPKSAEKSRIINRLRLGVQIVFFVLVVLIAAGHTLEESGVVIPLIGGASLHAVCPFGGAVTLYKLFTDGTYVQKIHASSVVLLILVGITAILAGPLFCGWACPLGSFQEWLGKLGRKMFGKRYNRFVPEKIDRWLRFLRYAVLVWVVYMTAVSAKLVFADYDPYYALFNFWTGEVAVTGFIALGLVIVLTLFVERPFCKYACPYGALLGLFNFIRIFKLRRNPSTCISCSLCDKACPMNIEVSSAGAVRDHQCISCYACTSETVCPVPDTVSFRTSRYRDPEHTGRKQLGRKQQLEGKQSEGKQINGESITEKEKTISGKQTQEVQS